MFSVTSLHETMPIPPTCPLRSVFLHSNQIFLTPRRSQNKVERCFLVYILNFYYFFYYYFIFPLFHEDVVLSLVRLYQCGSHAGHGRKDCRNKSAGAGQTLDTRMLVKNLQNVRLNSFRVFTAVPCQERSVA